VTAKRLRALAYLAYRALVAHPLKRARRRGSGLARFTASYGPEGLVPTLPEDRAIGELAAACIGCGLCELGCDLAAAAPAVRAMGLPAAFRLYGRSSVELPLAREALEACRGCAGCEPLCPTGVPIGRIVRSLLQRATEAEESGADPAMTQRTPDVARPAC
jgi:heterodisulfide reductase subunit C